MESHAAKLIRGTYDAVNARRIEEWGAANLPPDFVLIPRAPAAGASFTGPEGVARFFADLDEAWESIRIEIDELIEFDGRVVVLGRVHNRGRGSGMDLEVVMAHVWTIENDVPVRAELIGDREEALRRGREGV